MERIAHDGSVVTPLDEEALRAAIGKTGYEVQGVSARPYEKKGLFGFLKK